MSQLRLELRQNPTTGRHDLVVKLESDRDLTSHEHEALHRKLVGELLGKGFLDPEQLGGLVIEREQGRARTPDQAVPEPHPKRKTSELSD